MDMMVTLQKLMVSEDKKAFLDSLSKETQTALRDAVKSMFPGVTKEKSAEHVKALADLETFEKANAALLKQHAGLRAEVKKHTGHIRVADQKYKWVNQDGTPAAKPGSGFVVVQTGKLVGKRFPVNGGATAWKNEMVNDGGFTVGQMAAIDKAMREVKGTQTLVKQQ